MLQWVQNLFSSKRLVVLRRFFMVVYRDTPGERLSGLLRHSVHSSVTIMRTPLLLAIILQTVKPEEKFTQMTIFAHFVAKYQLDA